MQVEPHDEQMKESGALTPLFEEEAVPEEKAPSVMDGLNQNL